MMLAGIAVGVAVGYGVDWLVKTFPLFTVVGVFAGFGLALYAVFLETK
jgi:F0F1-type ATP synthase assembly protein I